MSHLEARRHRRLGVSRKGLKAAVDAGIVDEVLPLHEIPEAMVRLVR